MDSEERPLCISFSQKETQNGFINPSVVAGFYENENDNSVRDKA